MRAVDELLVVRPSEEYRKGYHKSTRLREEFLEIVRLEKPYDEYIAPSLAYFKQDTDSIAAALGVKGVTPKGLYIMGIFGGEKGRDKCYAGLALEDYEETDSEIKFKLFNTTSSLRVPKEWFREFGVNIYKVVYVGMINPFKILGLVDVILSANGAKALKSFLLRGLRVNADKLRVEDLERIRGLINELRQPSRIAKLEEGSYYVVYRCDRAFTAAVVAPKKGENIIVESHVSAIECEFSKQAYYYAGILNYLAHTVVRKKRNFIHHQFARPALAVAIAGLSWNDVNEDVRERVAELSKELSGKLPLRKFSNQRQALKSLEVYDEFKQLINILDEIVDKERLEMALNLVSGKALKR